MNKAGRKKEIVFQLMKRAKELRRDMEFVLTNNQTPVPNASASSTTARALRPINAWYSTNTVRGASGANGSSTARATDGTQVALTEKNLKTVIQSAWTSGGDPDLIMTGPFNKTQISAFGGNVTRIQDTSNRELKTAIDLYASDFGEHRIVPNKFSRDRDVHVLTTDLWAISYLRPMQTIDLAKTGDSEKGMVLAEYTLESRNEAGSGIVADVTTS